MPRPEHNSWFRYLKIAAGVVVAGVLPFFVLEAGLRMFGYGYPTGFFVPLANKAAFGSNEMFGRRFFPASMARTPVVSYVPAVKQPNTYRIFVLGDSAAMGIPEPAFSFSRMLRVMLESRYPGAKFEVINTAMTAINSHVLVPIAADSAKLQPDAFIVLAGNNEVVGPYGPGTVLAGYSSVLPLIRAGIWFRSTRTAEWMEQSLSRLRKSAGPREWNGMAMFAGQEVSRDDPRLLTVYGNFRSNLKKICEIARRAGAATLLVTVPVNLKDSAPFVSTHVHALNAGWQPLYDTGMAAARAGDCAAATEKFRAAAALDDGFADLHYRLGHCLLDLHRTEDARRQFEEARDMDALRFRADSRINQTIRNVAAEEQTGARLADPAGDWGLTGDELFYEHVHLNFDGNYKLANSLLAQVDAMVPERIQKFKRPSAALRKEEVADALAYTEWDRDKSSMEMLAMMLDAPFTRQSDFGDRKQEIERTLHELREKWASPGKSAGLLQHLARYELVLKHDPENIDLREIVAELFSRSGDHMAAAAQYRAMIGYVPTVARWHANLAHELAESGRLDEARNEAETGLRIDGQAAPALFTMGLILERSGYPAEATERYEAALRVKPDYAEADLRLAIIFGKQGRYREAADRYQAFLKLTPGSAEVESNLGFLLVKLGDAAGAVPHYREALRLRPSFPEAANNLGAALERLGKRDESIAYYQMALRLRPGFAEAHQHLANALAASSHNQP